MNQIVANAEIRNFEPRDKVHIHIKEIDQVCPKSLILYETVFNMNFQKG